MENNLSSNFDVEHLHPFIINANHSNMSDEALLCLLNNGEHNILFPNSNNNESVISNPKSDDGKLPISPIISDLRGYEKDNLESHMHCNASWDGMLCWPETPVGTEQILPCFTQLNGVSYNTSGMATRFCEEDGSWQNLTDYANCHPLHNIPGTDDRNLIITTGVYMAGYSLSLCFLGIALIIFVSFKELRCLRNKIHTHLIITYILSDTLWIIMSFMSSQANVRASNHHVPCITYIILHYFHMTNFFWMFVEGVNVYLHVKIQPILTESHFPCQFAGLLSIGVYLYFLVVQTFIADNIKLRVYAAIGWGIPLMVVSAWSLAKWMNHSPHETQNNDPEFGNALPVCLWLNETLLDWIYKGAVIAVLACNIGFLFLIMWVLITKLRSAMNVETQQSRKAAKALFVLMPLLGITYLLILIGSKQIPLYEFVRALLISTQGFLVALFYCFLNGEVRVALRHQWNRIREVGPGFSCCGCEFDLGRQRMEHMRDCSPRSRTESIRLYTPSGHAFRKRESSASNATSMTILQRGESLNGSNMVPTMAVINKSRFSTTTVIGVPQTYKFSVPNESNTLV